MLLFLQCIIYFYISVLILRAVMTNQELYFNPLGKIVARATEPVFKNLLRNDQKTKENYETPVIIGFLTFLLGLFYWLVNGDNFVLSILVALSSIVVYLYFFYLISMFLGCFINTGSATFITTFFYRLGLFWVKIARKIINIKGNGIIFVAAILLTLFYLVAETLINTLMLYFIKDSPLISEAFFSSVNLIVYVLLYLLKILIWLIIIRVLLSWVSPDPRNVFVQILSSITDPMMLPFRRIIPPIGFIDISPIILIIIIEFIRMFFLRLLQSSQF